VGGLETMMEILAEEFVAAGQQVTVVTQTPDGGPREANYQVIRRPSFKAFFALLRRTDVCLYASVSLRGLWPIIIVRRPFVISHQTLYESLKFSPVAELKKVVTRFSTNIFCSENVKRRLSGQGIAIPNTYRSEIFREFSDVEKDLDIVFVGRLVAEKGASDLLDAVSYLGKAGLRPRLSIVGDGPEYQALVCRVEELGVSKQVAFMGVKRGTELARFIARHRIMVVPSRWAEPFGIVALEGIGCGCVVVGTDQGGLPEAIGTSGMIVPAADPKALAKGLRSLLEDDSLLARYRSFAPPHLARHSRSAIAQSYLHALADVA
jgi:glycosyltransferase involved in cell wall biosynthesis